MTEFDIFVRRFLLAFPRSMHSRSEVVGKVFLGNGGGFHWQQGRLECIQAEDAARFRDEDRHRAAFFDNLDVWEKVSENFQKLAKSDDPEIAKMSKDFHEKLGARGLPDRAAWQDRLDRVDEIAQFVDPEAGIDETRDQRAAMLGYSSAMIEEAGIWFALVVPDDVEDSFLGGAIEALDMVHRSLPDMEVSDQLVEVVAYIETERARLHQMRDDRAAALGISPNA